MSETIEAAPPLAPSDDAPADRFGGVAFGSETATPPAPDPDGGESATSNPAPEEAPKTPGAPKVPAGLLKRIDVLTRHRREAEEEASRAKEENENLRRALAVARGEREVEPEPTVAQVRAEERAAAERRMAEQREQAEFGIVTRRVADSLAAKHGEGAIGTATQALAAYAGLDFGNRQHQQIIRDISELPNSGEVYYALAHDPDAASELFSAPERRQLALLEKFATKLTPPSVASTPNAPASPAPQVSKAPPPVAATGGSTRTVSSRSIYDPDLSPEEYIRLRSKK
ncbi:hypothetical protein [Acidomonas methanolica]|uniref:Uncharacterized protein n=1 Tax=Acidomonas methanolica NBRC 104435 TaxID=1231351 RepID=A0A023D6F2_ACIMT|nr:hypothetical protein [Acidomonas methanolica]TCS24119.1 hypothetical protein EDC31_12540 [Acidomonas methanolica]GAJ29728.1 hypothetical protein Amme_076_021 [Acidomonas methanolica NBRC 104435]GBQ59461.1 hypothetical protein AA0498_2760 [Acidomonas methanolica]GEL00034.1 hypothetical protein AME01nite_25320 [Acidomonas methanolica NBRC 104435]